jgi:hypothetical protein
MFLIHEASLDGVQPFFATVDATPDAGLSEVPLYTNPRSGDGILQANELPPVAKDTCLFADRMWYANTKHRHQIRVKLIGTGTPDGIQAGDTVTVGGITMTASATPPASALAYEFEAVTYLTPSRNVEETATSFAGHFNYKYSPLETTDVFVDYLNDTETVGADFIFTAESFDAAAFTFTSSRATCWDRPLPITSTNDVKLNGLFYSRVDQPTAVPLLNYLLIGAANKQILRILPLREKLFVFKEDGIFTVAGEEPFRVDQLDATTRLVAPDTAVVFNNQILALTNQGVVAVSDAGVQLLSRPIEDQLLPYLTAANRSTVQRYAFSLAHETDRVYELWVPAAGDTSCTTAFVYNSLTNAWTTWEHSTGHTFGTVDPTDVRHYGADSSKVLVERRDFVSSDYADETLAVTISAISGTSVTVSSASGITVGDVLTLDSGADEQSVVITAINGTVLTVSETIISALTGQTSGTVQLAFESDIQWAPVAFDRPGTTKRFQYGHLHFGRPTAFHNASATYETELKGYIDTVAISTTDRWGWGLGEWGVAYWGDATKSINLRHTIPTEQQRAAMVYPGFRIREAYASWKLHGLTLDTEENSERTAMS